MNESLLHSSVIPVNTNKFNVEEKELNVKRGFIRLLSMGNTKALNVLYSRYAGALYGYILRSVSDTVAAGEILVRVFAAARKQVGTYDASKCRLFTWLFHIARKEVLSYQVLSLGQ